MALAPLTEEFVLPSWNCLCTFVKKQLPGPVPGFSVLSLSLVGTPPPMSPYVDNCNCCTYLPFSELSWLFLGFSLPMEIVV